MKSLGTENDAKVMGAPLLSRQPRNVTFRPARRNHLFT